MQRTATVTFCVIWTLTTLVGAQGTDYRAVESPFQEDFEYTVNTDLEPMVEVAGVRWARFGVHVKGDREIEPDKEMPVMVNLEFNNTNSNGVKILVIALFEDANGNPLSRLECSSVNVGSDRLKEAVQKYKIPGAVLRATQRVYLYFEVE